MDNVDIVSGYPWMQLVGIININIEKKFLKLSYKKKKVTLHDISLTTLEDPKGEPTNTSTGTLEVIPIETSDDESMVAKTIVYTTTQEYMTQNVHQSTKTAPQEP